MKVTRILFQAVILLGLVVSSSASILLIEHYEFKLENGVDGHIIDIPDYDPIELREATINGEIVVFYGNVSDNLGSIYNTSLFLDGEIDNSTSLIGNGVWLQESNGIPNEFTLIVKDYERTPASYGAVNNWFEYLFHSSADAPTSLHSRTEYEFQEPYGVLETQTELLKVNDTSNEFDWYDVTVTQKLTPGSNTSGSDWEWGWLTYTMNGSKGDSNVFLSDYDAPPSNEIPTGLFSFLWRILNFHPRDFFPWFYQNEPQVEGVDMSDFSLETYTVRYQAPLGYQKANEPLEMRHHYVLRVGDGEKPKFWQQTQVKYVRSGVIAAPPYFSPLLHEGYLELR